MDIQKLLLGIVYDAAEWMCISTLYANTSVSR